MIQPKNAVGSRKGGLFSNRKRLSPVINKETLQKWTLTNSKVTFNFIEDPTTGVRLESWQAASFSAPVLNQSRNLWQLNMLTSYSINRVTETPHKEVYTVYPSASSYSAPSVIPVITDSEKKFTFRWRDVRYDLKNPNYTCDVYIIATLGTNSNHLDIKFECIANQTYSSQDLEAGASCVVSNIHFPSIVIAKDKDEEVNDQFILSAPVSVGYTYYNPFKYLRAPRYETESFQFNYRAERAYAAGFIGSPTASLYKYNYCNPGGLTIPALVIGNKGSKEGTLIYGMDQEGTNPKGFQWYVDDKSLHIHIYHNSDYEIDPYGVGGYYIQGSTYSIKNAPTWTLRIRPFLSESTWVDWKGFEIYKEEAVIEQEAYGWLPKSFYQRYEDGELTKEAAEIPMVLNLGGYTTGALDTAERSLSFYKAAYKNSVTPAISKDPYIPIHYQTAHLGYSPNRINNSGDTRSTYNGWAEWCGSGISVIGPEFFKEPSAKVNAIHETTYQRIFQNSGLLYHYAIFPFIISSGAAWTIEYSGIDLIAKDIHQEDTRFTNDIYKHWAYSGQSAGLFSNNFMACFALDVNKEKFLSYAQELGDSRASCYHDTVGNYSRGCYAKDHKYYDPILGNQTIAHPRGGNTKYFNDLQFSWLSGYGDSMESAYLSGDQSIPVKDWKLARSSEFPCDLNLKNVPIALIYEPLGPILNAYFNKKTDPRPDSIFNIVAGTNIDGLSDVEIETFLGSVDYWACLIKPPNWIQRCPGYQIALSDRAIFNEWSAVYTTNTFDQFLSGNVQTGVGTYGQILKRPLTTGEWAQQWASFSAMSWPFTNRVAGWHLDSQIGYVDANFSDIENDESVIFARPEWSGLYNNFCTKLFRIQAYNPDYMYHGSFAHPLESWESSFNSGEDISSAINALRSSITNARSPFSGNPGIEKVQHSVRRHRNNGNLLFTLGNWHSGNNQFSATFDPASYGINNGYQVYYLDVNTASHGTKTLLSVKSPNEVFDIDVTLGQYEYAIYEIEVNSSSLDPTIFADLKTDYVPIRYSYDLLPITTEDVTFAYSYGTTNISELIPPMEGYRSPSTQQILNNVPQWMKGRQNFDSNMWKLVNSWGMSMDNVIEQSYKNAADLNLITADTTYLSKLNYIDITSKELLENKTKKNLLFNSSFSIKDATRTNLPAGWELYGSAQDTEIDYRNSSVVPCAISSSSGTIKVGQQILMNNALISSLTASMYVLSDSPSTNIKLFISVEKTDGTSFVSTASIASRSAEWRRLVLPFTVNSQVYRINFTILASCSTKVTVCAPQLEVEGISNWSSSYTDYLPYYPYVSKFNSVYAMSIERSSKKTPIHQIADQSEFINCAVPTRIVKTAAPTKSLSPYTSQAFGRKVDQLGEVVRTEFSVFNGQVVERSISPTSWDIFNRYSIKDLRYYEDLAYGVKDEFNVTILPITAAIRKDLLFVACKETYNGNTYRTLKIVRPRTTPNGEQYLEAFADYNLDLNFDTVLTSNQITDEEIFSISFSDIDPSYMLVTTTANNKYYYKLSFDYYYFDSQKNRMYFIETYKDARIMVI